MKRNLRLFKAMPALLLLIACAFTSKAQTFNETTPYVNITAYNDTLRYWVHNPHAGAYGTLKITVYYQGDFGDFGESMDLYGPNMTYLGTVGPNSTNTDCAADSAVLTFNATLINAFLPADSVPLILITSDDVDLGVCSINHAQLNVNYAYCAGGIPQAAAITLTDSVACPLDAALPLVGTPAGGTFSGTGVRGTTFVPANLPGGNYTVTYTATDIGCTISASKTILVLSSPTLHDTVVCPNTAATLTATGGGNKFVWYSNSALTNALDTSAGSFTTPSLNHTTTYYTAPTLEDFTFTVDTILSTNSQIVDINNTAGDDRGGIAVTNQYVFMNGDDNCVRFNLDLTNPVVLPIRDGIFSDLATGSLYTLYDGTNDPVDAPNDFNFTSIASMDSNLNIGAVTSTLSHPIDLGNDNEQNVIFAGAGIVIVYSGNTEEWYVVHILTGLVEDLGALSTPFVYGSENWSDWGVAEYDGSTYSVLYRDDNDNNIHRQVLTATGAYTVAGEFTDLNDLASFTMSPGTQRMYFHYESSGQFGGIDETLGFVDATTSPVVSLGGTLGCASKAIVTVNTVSIGPDTAACAGNGVTLYAGTGYSSYSWNGATTNFNTHQADSTGTYAVAVVDHYGCTLRDTAVVTIHAAPAVTLSFGSDFTYCSNAAAVTLSGASPANGVFSGAGVTSGVFTPATAGVGITPITYTYTDNNGCTGSATAYLSVTDCTNTGIATLTNGELSLYPNPTNGVVSIQFANTNVNDLAITVLDVQGRDIYHADNISMTGKSSIQLDLSGLSSGVYNISMTGTNLNKVEKLVIQK